MLAFNNDQTQADRLRAQVLAHEAADEIVQGTYWQNGKGCFIGCITHSDDALEAASLLGGDLMLIRIAERIFENLPNADAKTFPARVLLAPRVGADLSLVPWQFLHWLVTDALTLADKATREACQPAVEVLAAKAAGSTVAARAARAAAYAADATARAARAAARATRAACAARAAAAYAAYAAAYAAAADAADAADVRQAHKLVELLAAA